MMMCKRLAQVPMLCVPIYNMKLAMMQTTPIFTTISAHTKMAADKRGQNAVLARIISLISLRYSSFLFSSLVLFLMVVVVTTWLRQWFLTCTLKVPLFEEEVGPEVQIRKWVTATPKRIYIYICKFLQGGTPPVIRFYICWFITTINYIRCYKLVNKSHEYHIVIDQLN